MGDHIINTVDPTWLVDYAHQHRLNPTEAAVLFGVSYKTFLAWKRSRRCGKKWFQAAKLRIQAYESGKLDLESGVKPVVEKRRERKREWIRSEVGNKKYRASVLRSREKIRNERAKNGVNTVPRDWYRWVGYHEERKQVQRIKTLYRIHRLEHPEQWDGGGLNDERTRF